MAHFCNKGFYTKNFTALNELANLMYCKPEKYIPAF